MYSTLYWLTRLDSIHTLFCVLIAISGIVAFFCIMEGLSPYGDNEKLCKRILFKGCIPVAAFSSIVLVFLPTKNEAILIYAGGKTWEYVQSDTSLQKLPYKATDYIKTVLENEIKEAKEEASK